MGWDDWEDELSSSIGGVTNGDIEDEERKKQEEESQEEED